MIFFPCAALILPLIVQTYASGVKALYQSNLSVPGLSDAWDKKVQALVGVHGGGEENHRCHSVAEPRRLVGDADASCA